MWKQKFALNIGKQFGEDLPAQLSLLKQCGFEGYFFTWNREMDPKPIVEEGNRLGMTLQSIHAPFTKVKALWDADEEAAKDALDELLECLHACKELGAPIMVTHVYIGFKDFVPVTETGLNRYRVLVDEAERLGVKIAFENTEGEEYLAALMDAFKDSPAVGFCWDTGHEMCYNHSKDMLALYGDRLFCTHLNDNLGISDFEGNIYYTDDLHLLPFDGIADWDDIARRLDQWSFDNFMTFELKITPTKTRFENDYYRTLSLTGYLSECHKRACRVAVKRKVHQAK